MTTSKQDKELPSGRSAMVARRAELLAELFLQDLGSQFVARSFDNEFVDFIVGFLNHRGGVTMVPVEVKATEDSKSTISLTKGLVARMANSTPPGLLLVIDVKRNKVFMADFQSTVASADDRKHVSIPLKEIDDLVRSELIERLSA